MARAARIACALALDLAGCAALGEEPFSERRDPSGIAPWIDLGAVEFCLGDLRVAPAGAEAAGVCVVVDAPPPPACASDADCAGRERCLCGRCTAVTCEVDVDCGADMVCDTSDQYPRCARECATDESCGAGEVCQSGACRRPCAGAGDCQHGEVCSPSIERCLAVRCTSDANCLASETCVPQRAPRALSGPSVIEDGDGLVMYLESGGGVLRAVGTTGSSFRVDPEEPVAEGVAPAALGAGGGVTLFVERDGAIVRLRSDDGVSFGDARSVAEGAAPAVVSQGGGLSLFYLRDGAIRRADGDGDDFAERAEPALVPADVEDPLLWRGVESVGDPEVLLVKDDRGPIVRLYFSALGVESSSSVQFKRPVAPIPNRSVGYAASDGGPFAPYPFNPVFDRTLAFLTHMEESGPAVVFHEGRYLLYYEAGEAGAPRSANVGVAVNPPPVPVE